MRNVRGVLFADYVRMILGHKDLDWARHLAATDVAMLRRRIQPDGWYPMEVFERLGNAILDSIAHGDLEAVRAWGRVQATPLTRTYATLLAPGDPVETLARFRVLRSTFFDFEALRVVLLHDGEAEIAVHYHMGMPAEEAAAMQTIGFFEGLLELAGARDIQAHVKRRSWAGDPETVVALSWQ
jgi:hypothetical protein